MCVRKRGVLMALPGFQQAVNTITYHQNGQPHYSNYLKR
jgi:hypothetical protein